MEAVQLWVFPQTGNVAYNQAVCCVLSGSWSNWNTDRLLSDEALSNDGRWSDRMDTNSTARLNTWATTALPGVVSDFFVTLV